MNTTVNAGDTAWVLMATALVMIMTPGLAFFYGGLVRKKNILGERPCNEGRSNNREHHLKDDEHERRNVGSIARWAHADPTETHEAQPADERVAP